MKRAILPSVLFLLALLPEQLWAQPIIGGFVEANQAVRVEKNEALGDEDLGESRYPRSEVRFQLKLQDFGDRGEYFVRADFISDGTVADRSTVDLREAYVKINLFEWLDVKVGR
jgi:hypothetical protein